VIERGEFASPDEATVSVRDNAPRATDPDDVVRHVPPHVRPDLDVVGAMEHERRRRDRREGGADIEPEQHPLDRQRRPRARRHPLEPDEPPLEPLVADEVRRPETQDLRARVAGTHPFRKPGEVLRPGADRVVIGPRRPRRRVEDD
jgi:hypothetical protein